MRRLAPALLMTVVLGLLPFGATQAQENNDPFVINDVIVEESDTDRVKAQEVALDEAGNRYVFGRFDGNVEFGEGSNGQSLNGTDGDLFIAKYDTGNNLLWVQEFETSVRGALPSANAAGIEFDDFFGNLYVAGDFRGGLDVGSKRLSSGANADGFIAQLDPETGNVQWVNQIISGNQPVIVRDISATGTVVLTGRFGGIAEFPGQFETGETLLSLTPGGEDMFAVLYSQVGQTSFAVQAGGNGAEGLGVYKDDNIFTVVGDFAGTIRFRDSNGREQAELTSQDGNDGFVVNYNDNGQLRFVTQIAGPDSDSAVHVVQKRFDIYVAGSFFNQTTIGVTRLTSRGQNDTYVARISSLNGSVQRVTQIGSNDIDFLRGLDGDNADRRDGNIFVSGTFFGPQLIIGEGSTAIRLDKSDSSSRTAYLTAISVDGGVFTPSFGQIVQGRFNTNRITVDEDSSNIYLAGGYQSAVTFGSRTTGRAIELPEPTGQEGMAVAHYVSSSGSSSHDADASHR
ncbi:MAG: hypothetical protein MI924_13925 [Chloroflexales bacterium]|nr:hypothetical protein [Chloroflexales bacterium]